MTKPAIASVSMDISISNGHEMDQYVLTRVWTLNDTLSEEYQVVKNGTLLDADEIADFDKFLFSIIPPELFNLYFFDGEKIADFFLEEGSNARIKGAFLTLCGYDTFDIMSKNFRRVSAANAGSSSKSLNVYLEAKAGYQEAAYAYSATKQEFDDCEAAITNCEAELRELEQSYSLGGGITKDEWDGYLAELKAEEKKREVHNAWLKRVANDYLPFLIMLNPEIIKKDGAYDTEEGCLSLLGGPRKCKRYKTIKVQYQTLDMQTRTKNFTGWTAQIIQHEVDHCNGVLI